MWTYQLSSRAGLGAESKGEKAPKSKELGVEVPASQDNYRAGVAGHLGLKVRLWLAEPATCLSMKHPDLQEERDQRTMSGVHGVESKL